MTDESVPHLRMTDLTKGGGMEGGEGVGGWGGEGGERCVRGGRGGGRGLGENAEKAGGEVAGG